MSNRAANERTGLTLVATGVLLSAVASVVSLAADLRRRTQPGSRLANELLRGTFASASLFAAGLVLLGALLLAWSAPPENRPRRRVARVTAIAAIGNVVTAEALEIALDRAGFGGGSVEEALADLRLYAAGATLAALVTASAVALQLWALARDAKRARLGAIALVVVPLAFARAYFAVGGGHAADAHAEGFRVAERAAEVASAVVLAAVALAMRGVAYRDYEMNGVGEKKATTHSLSGHGLAAAGDDVAGFALGLRRYAGAVQGRIVVALVGYGALFAFRSDRETALSLISWTPIALFALSAGLCWGLNEQLASLGGEARRAAAVALVALTASLACDARALSFGWIMRGGSLRVVSGRLDALVPFEVASSLASVIGLFAILSAWAAWAVAAKKDALATTLRGARLPVAAALVSVGVTRVLFLRAKLAMPMDVTVAAVVSIALGSTALVVFLRALGLLIAELSPAARASR